MKPGKNLKDRLAKQSGLPTSGIVPKNDGGLGKMIEADRVKKRDAADGGKTAMPPPKGVSGHADTAPARSGGKSTTNQGLR